MNFFCTQVDGPLTGSAYKKQGLYVAVYGMPVIGGEIYALLCSGESTQVLLNWHGS